MKSWSGRLRDRLADLNERGDAGPGFRSLVVADEERAAVFKEADEHVPVVQIVAVLPGDLGLGTRAS